MHKQVEGNRNPRDGCKSNELRVAEKGGSSMMIGVQESCEQVRGENTHRRIMLLTKGFLLEYKEDGVNELDIFGDVVQLLNISLLVL